MFKTRRMKPWSVVFVLANLTLAAPVLAAQLELSVGRTKAPAEQLVKVPINAEAMVAAGAMQMDLRYDPEVLTFMAVENGPLLTSALVESNVSAPGQLRIALTSNEEVKGKGVLLSVEFQVQTGNAETVALQLEKARAWDQANNLEMTVEARGGEFTRTGPAGGIPVWVWIAGGGALIALALLLVARRRTRKPAGAAGTPAR